MPVVSWVENSKRTFFGGGVGGLITFRPQHFGEDGKPLSELEWFASLGKADTDAATATEPPPSLAPDAEEQARQKEKLRDGLYAYDRLPEEIERASDIGAIAEPLAVVRKFHASIHHDKELAAGADVGARKLARQRQDAMIRRVEERYLARWAGRSGCWLQDGTFEQRWRKGGELAGGEHQLYFDEERQLVVKRNALALHTTWLAYFQRLAAHNYLFPAAAYRFVGFEICANRLQALVEQPAIHFDIRCPVGLDEAIRTLQAHLPGTVERVTPALAGSRMASNRLFHELLHHDSGLVFEDMHAGNIVRDCATGELVAIDLVIRLDRQTKHPRLRQRYGLPVLAEEVAKPGTISDG